MKNAKCADRFKTEFDIVIDSYRQQNLFHLLQLITGDKIKRQLLVTLTIQGSIVDFRILLYLFFAL